MRNLMRGGVEVVVILLCAVGAYGDVISLPLNCAGTYDNNTPYRVIDFDLGVTFSQISNVYIDWSGQITAALAEFYYDPGNSFPIDEGIAANLVSNPLPAYTKIYGGQGTYPMPESFDQISAFSLFSGSSWSDFLDGRGTIRISRSGLVGTFEWYYVERGTIELNNATLIFEGTIIPEPATLLLLSIGIFGIRIKRNGYRNTTISSNNIL